MERVIVTGASGFIGRNFIKYLDQKKIEVFAIVRNSNSSIFDKFEYVHVITCPLNNISMLEQMITKKGFDAFYHFAWEGTTGQKRTDYTLQSNNCKYTCDAAKVSKVLGCKKFITTGTITEHVAEEILKHNYTSEHLVYGIAKYYTHNLLDILCYKEGIDYIWAKLSNIYGGDNTNGNLISYTIKEFQGGRKPSYGPCEQPYNFTYIDDVLDALYLLGSKITKKKEYFISNGECRQLKEYLIELADMFRKEVVIGKRADDGIAYKDEWFNNQALLEEGFRAKYKFTDGIKVLKGESYHDTEV